MEAKKLSTVIHKLIFSYANCLPLAKCLKQKRTRDLLSRMSAFNYHY